MKTSLCQETTAKNRVFTVRRPLKERVLMQHRTASQWSALCDMQMLPEAWTSMMRQPYPPPGSPVKCIPCFPFKSQNVISSYLNNVFTEIFTSEILLIL